MMDLFTLDHNVQTEPSAGQTGPKGSLGGHANASTRAVLGELYLRTQGPTCTALHGIVLQSSLMNTRHPIGFGSNLFVLCYPKHPLRWSILVSVSNDHAPSFAWIASPQAPLRGV